MIGETEQAAKDWFPWGGDAALSVDGKGITNTEASAKIPVQQKKMGSNGRDATKAWAAMTQRNDVKGRDN